MNSAIFSGFDHVDARVKSLAAVEKFYDLLMPALGLPRKRFALVNGDDWQDVTAGDIYNAVEYIEAEVRGAAPAFIGLIEDAHMIPTGTRIAFRIPDASLLESWATFLREIGAGEVEMSQDPVSYPAVFFEDPAGTKLEICARRAG